MNTKYHQSTTDSKVHTFYTTGIFSHIISILLIALYTTLDNDDTLQFDAIGLTINRETFTHVITILTLVLLFVSHTLRLAWLLRKEEMLAIIIVWTWIGNVLGDSASLLGHHSPCDLMASLGIHGETIVPQVNETVIIASDVVNHHPSLQPHHHPVCGWNLFNLYFSILCLFSVLVSFLCQTRNYCLSFFFRTLSLLTSVIVFFVPIACNRFHMTSTPVLILKITLYNIAWNMNRYMIVTQGDISSNYSRGESIMRSYEEVYWPLINPGTHRRKTSRYYDEDSESDTLGSDSSGEEEEDDDDDYETGGHRHNPQKIFKSFEKTNAIVRKLPLLDQQQQQQPKRRQDDQQQQVQAPQQRRSRMSEEARIVSTQIQYFRELYRISRRFPSSWKNSATYNDRLSDFARTVWILALCPLYLFVVIPFLILIGYYIRRNLIELSAQRKTLSSMENTEPVK